MQLFSWLHKRLTGQSHTRRTPARKPTPRFRPQLEALEDRLVPSTLTVTNNLDTGFAGDGSLRGEIAAAKNNDTIVFDPSLSGQTIRLISDAIDGELVINKNLTIQGPSAPLSPVTIDGVVSRVFEVDGAKTVVSLSNLNLIDGTGTALNPLSAGAINGQGGAIWNGGTLTISACSLSGNSATEGGAIYNAGTLSVSNGTLDNNSAGERPAWDPTYGGDGGAIYNIGTLTVSNSILDGNTAFQGYNGGGDGGAIYNTGTVTVSNGTLDDNTAYYGGYGGGIFNAYRASATITGSSLSGNFAFYGYNGGYGGGIYNDGTMTLSGSSASGNSGGIFNDKKGHLAITSKSSVVSNSGYDVYNLGVVKISTDSDVGVIVK